MRFHQAMLAKFALLNNPDHACPEANLALDIICRLPQHFRAWIDGGVVALEQTKRLTALALHCAAWLQGSTIRQPV